MINYCSNCGTKIDKESNYCSHCGAQLIEVEKNNNELSQPKYADIKKRIMAFIVDTIILVVLFILAIEGLGLFDIHLSSRSYTGEAIFFLLFTNYFIIMESSEKQATFGKQLLNLKVVDLDFQRISIAVALGRHWGKILSILSCGTTFLFVFTTKRKQGLYDMMSSTVVINNN